MPPIKGNYSKSAIFADFVGITHFLLANILIVLGKYTSIFGMSWGKDPGISFVYHVLDAPVYYAVAPYIGSVKAGTFHNLLVAELVITVSSVLYGLIVYLACKLIATIF